MESPTDVAPFHHSSDKHNIRQDLLPYHHQGHGHRHQFHPYLCLYGVLGSVSSRHFDYLLSVSFPIIRDYCQLTDQLFRDWWTSTIIYKVTKFACKSIKGKGVRSGIRIIYAYYEKENIIEFIEIYHKSDKPNEDKQRIIDHYKLDVRSWEKEKGVTKYFLLLSLLL